MNILYVEDEIAHYETFRIAIKDLKPTKPIDVFWAKNDQEALELVERQEFNLVFMDIGLKGSAKDGIALTRYIKNELKKDWPLVVFSISRDEKDKQTALAAGADFYLPKPYGYMEMFMNIGELISQVHRGMALGEG